MLEYTVLELRSCFNKNRSLLIVTERGQLETLCVILFILSKKVMGLLLGFMHLAAYQNESVKAHFTELYI